MSNTLILNGRSYVGGHFFCHKNQKKGLSILKNRIFASRIFNSKRYENH